MNIFHSFSILVLKLTTDNCLEIYKICDFYNDTRVLRQTEAFIKTNLRELDSFKVIDLIKNLTNECIEVIMESFDGEISQHSVYNIKRMSLCNFKVLFYEAVMNFKNEEILRFLTLTLLTVERFKEHLVQVIKFVHFRQG